MTSDHIDQLGGRSCDGGLRKGSHLVTRGSQGHRMPSEPMCFEAQKNFIVLQDLLLWYLYMTGFRMLECWILMDLACLMILLDSTARNLTALRQPLPLMQQPYLQLWCSLGRPIGSKILVNRMVCPSSNVFWMGFNVMLFFSAQTWRKSRIKFDEIFQALTECTTEVCGLTCLTTKGWFLLGLGDVQKGPWGCWNISWAFLASLRDHRDLTNTVMGLCHAC